MKQVRTMFLLLTLLLLADKTLAQKYTIPGCPLNGCFYVDTTKVPKDGMSRYMNRYVNIVSDDSSIYASGKGRVVICEPRAGKTYEIGIRYAAYVVIYTNVKRKRVRRDDLVDIHSPIGDLSLDPKDKHYHLGLQVVKADNPREQLWGRQLAQYLGATQTN